MIQREFSTAADNKDLLYWIKWDYYAFPAFRTYKLLCLQCWILVYRAAFLKAGAAAHRSAVWLLQGCRQRMTYSHLWQVKSLYYALPSEKQSNCQKFNLTVQLLPGNFSVFCGCFLFYLCLFFLYLPVYLYEQTNSKVVSPLERVDGDQMIYKMKIAVL